MRPLWFTGGVNSLRRSFVAFGILVSLLFSQLAVATYACPQAESMAATAPLAIPDMPDCDNMAETPRDALCQAHCQQTDQSRDMYQASVPAAALTAGPSRVVAPQDAARESPRPRGFYLERRIEPPVSIRHCRLHI